MLSDLHDLETEISLRISSSTIRSLSSAVKLLLLALQISVTKSRAMSAPLSQAKVLLSGSDRHVKMARARISASAALQERFPILIPIFADAAQFWHHILVDRGRHGEVCSRRQLERLSQQPHRDLAVSLCRDGDGEEDGSAGKRSTIAKNAS
jgi:hypothetical protein